MFCVEKVWLLINTQRGMFVWLNYLSQEVGRELEKEYFMQPEQMQAVVFQGEFLEQDE